MAGARLQAFLEIHQHSASSGAPHALDHRGALVEQERVPTVDRRSPNPKETAMKPIERRFP